MFSNKNNSSPHLINIRNLQKDVQNRQSRNVEIYNEILQLVHKKILNTNEKNNDCNCIQLLLVLESINLSIHQCSTH